MLRGKLFGNKQQAFRAHSLEHLKLLYESLRKVDWSRTKNVETVVESLRTLAEILIWGDQNDPSVFDYFLEKQMLSYFVQIIQKCAPDVQASLPSTSPAGHETVVAAVLSNAVGVNQQQQVSSVITSETTAYSGASLTQEAKNHICVQVLQLLCILFENTEHQTSLYYLLSNNHVNNIIESSYDFSNDDVLAQYISMLKALSLKLNAHTIHFFFNEQTRGFAILRHCLNFLSHEESMVRIASRTVCLNVLRVDEERARRFIVEYHADFVLSRIVHEVRQHLLLKFDKTVRRFYAVASQGPGSTSPTRAAFERLRGLHDDYCDYIGFLNEVFTLNCSSFSSTLRLHLLNKLFIPVHLTSLFEFIGTRKVPDDDDSLLHPVTALYSLGLCFSLLRDSEFFEDLSIFMLSRSSALAVNEQSFFDALLEILRLSPVNGSNSSTAQSEIVTISNDSAVEQQLAVPPFFMLILPLLCFVLSMSQSTTFKTCPSYRKVLVENELLVDTLVQFTSKLCQNEGKRFAIICLHLAVSIAEVITSTPSHETVMPPAISNEVPLPLNDLASHADERSSLCTDDGTIIMPASDNRNSTADVENTDKSPELTSVQRSIVGDHHIASLEDAKEHCLLTLRRFYQPTHAFVLAYASQYESVRCYTCKLDNLWLHALSCGTYQELHHQHMGRRPITINSMVASQDELVFSVMCDASDSETSALRTFLLLSKLCYAAGAEKTELQGSSFERMRLDDDRASATVAATAAVGAEIHNKTPTDFLSKDDLLDVTKCELLSCGFYETWNADASSPPSASKSPANSSLSSGSSPQPACGARSRFLVAHPRQLVLVEPSKKTGIAAVHEVFPLHLCLVVNDKNERTRSALLLKVFALHPWAASGDYEHFIASGGSLPGGNGGGGNTNISPVQSPPPGTTTKVTDRASPARPQQHSTAVQLKLVVDGRLKFDDHIRCAAAAHKLKERKAKLLELHLQRLASILDLPAALRPASSNSSRASSTASGVTAAAQPKALLSRTTDVGKPPIRIAPSAIESMHQQQPSIWSSPSRRPRPGGLARLLTTAATLDGNNTKSGGAAITTTAVTVQHDVVNSVKILSADIPMIYMPPSTSVSSTATTPVNSGDNILIDLTPENPSAPGAAFDMNHFPPSDSAQNLSGQRAADGNNNSTELFEAVASVYSSVPSQVDGGVATPIIHVPSSESEPVLSIMQREGDDSTAATQRSSFALLSSSSASSENNIFSSRPSTAASSAATTAATMAAFQKKFGGGGSSESAGSSTSSSPNRDSAGTSVESSGDKRKTTRRTHKPGAVHHI